MSESKKINSAISWLWLSVLVIALDQIVKHVVVAYLPYNQAVPVLSFFNLALSHNTGAAFSFLANAGSWAPWVLGGFATLISAVILFWLLRTPRTYRLLGFALALILGGALGNLIDRIHYGYVIDFLQVYYKQWYWPAFNVADSAITVGAILLGVEIIFRSRKS